MCGIQTFLFWQMAPVARILVWAISEDGHVVSHGVAMPIDPLSRHKVSSYGLQELCEESQ